MFFLNALEEICVHFSLPLSLYHGTKLDNINRRLESTTFFHEWTRFKESLNMTEQPNSEIVIHLRTLSWIVAFVLDGVGSKIVERKLGIDMLRFRAIQAPLANEPFFASVDLNPQIEWSDADLLTCLHSFFGANAFKPLQREAIVSAMSGKDILCLFPTGFGKSLIYQLPATIQYGVTVVFCPLCSLLSDQLAYLQGMGISSVWLHSDLAEDDLNHILVSLNTFVIKWRVVLVTPEKFCFSKRLRNTMENLYRRNLILRFVFDEVHCLSQWGRSFRPTYLDLVAIREWFPRVPIIALTATANATTVLDVKHLLQMDDCLVYQHSFNRPNLSFNVRKRVKCMSEEIAKLILNQFQGMAGIVYCRTKKECELLHKVLTEKNIKAGVYHSDVKNVRKEEVLSSWIDGRIPVVVATIAFGLGT